MNNSTEQQPHVCNVGQLRKYLSEYNDQDIVVVEIHEGTRAENLYAFSVDAIHGLNLQDGTEVSEVRFCI